MNIAVGMSGGVDSSAAALLLHKAGENIIGVTLRLTGLPQEEIAISDAKKACDSIGIKHHVLDLREDFEKNIKAYFLDQYSRGRTPNPCVRCNKTIKFGRMIRICSDMGYEYIATGHYADRAYVDGKWYIKASGSKKDQSYMLWMLDQEQIGRVIFPISQISKQEARDLLRDNGIETFSKKDSQDICFIPDGDYIEYLTENGFKEKKGDIIRSNGVKTGEHSGCYRFTIGQRKGFGGGFEQPMFVTAIDADKNEIRIGTNDELFSHNCRCDNCNFVRDIEIGGSVQAEAKIRYSAKKTGAIVTRTGKDTMDISFSEPQRAITPGQSAVVYDGDLVICGGEIISGGK